MHPGFQGWRRRALIRRRNSDPEDCSTKALPRVSSGGHWFVKLVRMCDLCDDLQYLHLPLQLRRHHSAAFVHRSKDTMSPAMEQLRTSTNRNDLALAILRIAVGGMFLIFSEYKVFGTQFTLHGGFEGWINRFLQDGAAYPLFVPILQRVVLPHATAIAFFVAYGELAIGLALVLGIFVRAASAFGLAFMIALLLSSNFPGHHAQFWQYFGASLDHSVFGFCFLAFMLGRSDTSLSIRTLLSRF
jgi:thiosulfate dehydrogenase (quinone) large subunit